MDDERRWQQVCARDAAADGRFVYAVRTTGVYCRPSCASRPARRENVLFFDTPVDAQAGGYRACKRCRPDGEAPQQHRREQMLAACRALEQSEAGIALADLAAAAGLSPHHFHRLFREVIGLTPKAYWQAVRARRLADALPQSASVTEAMLDAGFNSPSAFYGAQRQAGAAPRRLREGGRGLRLRHAVEPCSLGWMLLAATETGVCLIEFGAEPQPLQDRLEARYPQAEQMPADAAFRAWVREVLDHVEQPRGELHLPLDVQGTVFQQRVWQALRAVPCGQTVSYAELARRVGQPGSARAVARACASNEVAVAIPCHRVVRGDGSLSGYRWGPERKAELLRREAAGVAAAADGPGRDGPPAEPPEPGLRSARRQG